MKQPTESIERLSAVSAELLGWLKETAQGTEAFVLEQAPLYVQEYVAWVFWSNLFGVSLATAVLVVWFVGLATSFFVYLMKKSGSTGNTVIGFLIIGLFVGTAWLIATPVCATKAIKAKVAPRVVIVEHVGEVLR